MLIGTTDNVHVGVFESVQIAKVSGQTQATSYFALSIFLFSVAITIDLCRTLSVISLLNLLLNTEEYQYSKYKGDHSTTFFRVGVILFITSIEQRSRVGFIQRIN